MKEYNCFLIDQNPFQVRLSENKRHVLRLADSILRDGLLQIPVGRFVSPGRIQLAFGHNRLAAFRLLAKEGVTEFENMPVDIRDLTDQQMFEMAVAENVTRKNMTPIEEAKAMRRYRDEFGKSSVEIGQLFCLSDSAVRNKMRLLDLPIDVQASLEAGEISEKNARGFLTVQRLAPERVKKVLDAAIDGSLSYKEIDREIARNINVAQESDWDILDQIDRLDLPEYEAIRRAAKTTCKRCFLTPSGNCLDCPLIEFLRILQNEVRDE